MAHTQVSLNQSNKPKKRRLLYKKAVGSNTVQAVIQAGMAGTGRWGGCSKVQLGRHGRKAEVGRWGGRRRKKKATRRACMVWYAGKRHGSTHGRWQEGCGHRQVVGRHGRRQAGRWQA